MMNPKFKTKIDANHFKLTFDLIKPNNGCATNWAPPYYMVDNKKIFKSLVGSHLFTTHNLHGVVFPILLNGSFIFDSENGLLIIKTLKEGRLYDMYYTNYNQILHNEQGPAVVLQRGIPMEEYYLYGKTLSKQEWEEQIQTKLYW